MPIEQNSELDAGPVVPISGWSTPSSSIGLPSGTTSGNSALTTAIITSAAAGGVVGAAAAAKHNKKAKKDKGKTLPLPRRDAAEARREDARAAAAAKAATAKAAAAKAAAAKAAAKDAPDAVKGTFQDYKTGWKPWVDHPQYHPVTDPALSPDNTTDLPDAIDMSKYTTTIPATFQDYKTGWTPWTGHPQYSPVKDPALSPEDTKGLPDTVIDPLAIDMSKYTTTLPDTFQDYKTGWTPWTGHDPYTPPYPKPEPQPEPKPEPQPEPKPEPTTKTPTHVDDPTQPPKPFFGSSAGLGSPMAQVWIPRVY